MKIRKEDQFSTYEKIEVIASGGQGDVYLVKRRSDGQYFALKVAKPSIMKDKKQANRIKTEAILLNQLNHSNILKVVDYFENKFGGFCTVSEYKKCYTL